LRNGEALTFNLSLRAAYRRTLGTNGKYDILVSETSRRFLRLVGGIPTEDGIEFIVRKWID